MSDESGRPAESPAQLAHDTGAPPKRRVGLLLSVAAVILTLDVVTKVLAVHLLTPGQPVPIVGDTITWTLVRNSGAAFSMAKGKFGIGTPL